MRRTRRNHAAGFLAKVALAALKGDKTFADLAQELDLHASSQNLTPATRATPNKILRDHHSNL